MGSHTQVKEVPFNTAVAFLDGLEAFNSEYGPPDYRSPWVFRGHIDAAWELRPSAWRDDGMKKLEPLKKWLEPQVKAYALSNGVGERKLERCVQQAAEVFAVRQFCDLADDLGLLIDHAHEVPDRGSAIENAVGRYLPNGRIDTDHVTFVDMPFAFAQHHGIPTRYMDWTRDPHVAAYFAVNGAIGAAGKSTDRVCVFAIKRDGVARKGIKWIVVPRSQHHYLHAQHGLFLRMMDPYGYVESECRWPALTDVTLDPVLEIQKLTLPIGEADLARDELFARRFSRAHLMPTFDNVATVTRERWDRLV